MAIVLAGICADGFSLNPMIIYKCEEFLSEWFDNLREEIHTPKYFISFPQQVDR